MSSLEHEHLSSRAGEIGGGREAVMAATDDDGVVSHCGLRIAGCGLTDHATANFVADDERAEQEVKRRRHGSRICHIDLPITMARACRRPASPGRATPWCPRSAASGRTSAVRRSDALATACWKPVFKYVRLKWRATPDEAADLTQAFFLRACREGVSFASFDPARARFRAPAHVSRSVRREPAAGRTAAETEAAPSSSCRSISWRRSPSSSASTSAMRRRSSTPSSIANGCAVCSASPSSACARRANTSGRARRDLRSSRYDLADDESTRPTYGRAGERAARSASRTSPTSCAAARREFRRLVLDVLREQCATDEEFRTKPVRRGRRDDL